MLLFKHFRDKLGGTDCIRHYGHKVSLLCTAGGKSRAAEVQVNADFTFDVFMCVTLLIKNRDKIFQCVDTADIIQFVCR